MPNPDPIDTLLEPYSVLVEEHGSVLIVGLNIPREAGYWLTTGGWSFNTGVYLHRWDRHLVRPAAFFDLAGKPIQLNDEQYRQLDTDWLDHLDFHAMVDWENQVMIDPNAKLKLQPRS